MTSSYQVIDLFAGPGGLAEGFSGYEDASGNRPFHVTLSVERDAAAHRTLQLRAFLRQFDTFPDEYYEALNSSEPLPDWAELYEGEWETALEEALCVELGSPEGTRLVDARIDQIVRLGVETVIIGGPPCQAYSLVGRARNKGITGYVPEKDHRHYLYKEYIRILSRLKPAAFVMENVKGILSSALDGERMFDRVVSDLKAASGEPDSYDLFALSTSEITGNTLNRAKRARDFIVRAEDFGVPQARHRVIIIGIRKDLAPRSGTLSLPGERPTKATVADVISAMPKLRSRLSRDDTAAHWRAAVIRQIDRAITAVASLGSEDLLSAMTVQRAAFSARNEQWASISTEASAWGVDCPSALMEWLDDPRLGVTLNHQARSHMESDLARYFFSAVFRDVSGRPAKMKDFPVALAPEHLNWETGKFADRFRAQGWDGPSTTVTSHISKDGHYFIHPDPQQCRALTVREAARLQTFPDNYLFLGNTTQQYVQVGNAVPPFLARQIAGALHHVLQ